MWVNVCVCGGGTETPDFPGARVTGYYVSTDVHT